MLASANPNYEWSKQRATPYGADVIQEWVAGDMLFSGAGASLYNPKVFQSWQHDSARIGFSWPESSFYPAVYPPPYFWVVAPLSLVPYRFAVLLWLGLLLLAYALAVLLIERFSWAKIEKGSHRLPAIAWCGLLFFPPLFSGLVMGQKGTLWLLLLVASWQLGRAGRLFGSGLVWSAIALKPTLFFLLPVIMVLQRQWRFTGGVIAGVLSMWGVAAIWIPSSLWWDYWQVISGSASYQSQAGYHDGWSVTLMSLLHALQLPRWLAWAVWLVLSSAMIVALVQPARWRGVFPVRQSGRFLDHRSVGNTGETSECAGVRTVDDASAALELMSEPVFLLRILLSTALVSPHFYYYDLVWLIYPLIGIASCTPRRAVGLTAILWLASLFAQWSPYGWPWMSLVCALSLIYLNAQSNRSGTSFAFLRCYQ